MTERSQAGRDKGASFLRVFRIVEAVVDASVPINATQIAKSVGLPVPTVHRICKMLVEHRFLQYEMDGKRLCSGPRMFDLGTRIISASHFSLERRAIMETLVDEVGETCNIALPDGLQMIYAERVETKWPLRIQLPVGTRVPIHCTASGKLYLSSLAPTVFDRVLRNIELKVYTARSIVCAEHLEAEVSTIRTAGYSTDDEEFIEGMVAVSVPIADPKGRFCAGLALHGPKFRTTLQMATDKLGALRRAARRIEDLMRIDASSIV